MIQMVVRVIMGSQSDAERTNELLTILKRLEIPYNVSVASCHRNEAELVQFVLSLKEQIIVFIGGMSLAAPGIIRSIYTANKVMTKIIFGIPLDVAARSAIEDLPAGTPVTTCGLNTAGFRHSLTNSALAIGHIFAVSGNGSVTQHLSEWYDEQQKEKPLVESVGLVYGLIPIPKKEGEKR